jgi:hypothetical protein
MPYEVDSAEGECLYRGNDLELACEIHDRVPSAYLMILPARTTAPESVPLPWNGPACRAVLSA